MFPEVLNPRTKQVERSTTVTNKGAFAAAVGAVDAQLAAAVEKEPNWRFGYDKHVVTQARARQLARVRARGGGARGTSRAS